MKSGGGKNWGWKSGLLDNDNNNDNNDNDNNNTDNDNTKQCKMIMN